ncbi:unnamed protein product [Cuscuta campestris]|uniref:Uncharacterized protein n=1 Tax=Cuscuta campestris TaxID=132261 RepID=A0A484L9C2_9ASTE|nr:unnamed protein product [Cuscuta campestris]
MGAVNQSLRKGKAKATSDDSASRGSRGRHSVSSFPTIPDQFISDALTDQEFDQYISGRGDTNLPTLDSLFEDIDEAGLDKLDGEEEPTPHSNDVDEEAVEPETSQGPGKGVSGGYGGSEKHLKSRDPVEYAKYAAKKKGRQEVQTQISRLAYRDPNQTSNSIMESMMKNFVDGQLKLDQEKLKFEQETKVGMQDLRTQVGQLATSISRLESQLSNKLPLHFRTPNESANAVTLCSGKSFGESRTKEREEKVDEECEIGVKHDQIINPETPLLQKDASPTDERVNSPLDSSLSPNVSLPRGQ